MFEEKTVQVIEIIEEDEWLQKLKTDGGAGKAILYFACCARVEAGESIKVNTTAERLKLGTGGWDIVITSYKNNHFIKGSGHIMKARYTACQHSVFAIDSPEHPDHAIFKLPFHLNDKKVLLAELHSMLPIILGALFMQRENQRVGIVLSDEAALPAGLSDHMRMWKSDPRVSVVTTGQSFGGTFEAVTIPNALQWLVLKKEVDVLIVSMGHGTVGTNTPFGFSGMAVAGWANLVGALKGQSVWVPRLSFQEKRQRHFGLSHHSVTPLKQFTYAPSTMVLPILAEEKMIQLEEQIMSLRDLPFLKIYFEEIEEWMMAWLEWYKAYPSSISTMGSDITNHPDFLKGVIASVKYI
ncbi:DUF3866 family protein [Alteribacillus sp. JSM 102045]|uniref:DUF3866 family protein n=1 Tax=Alteribacillus sp. JSM 102045 TaxID=1562101 RepID=UPI0035C205BF